RHSRHQARDDIKYVFSALCRLLCILVWHASGLLYTACPTTTQLLLQIGGDEKTRDKRNPAIMRTAAQHMKDNTHYAHQLPTTPI
ncbi:hypothetical protein COO60DRAFT_1549936, partial [Scenedesmus sp. NREL 46B-D3]